MTSRNGIRCSGLAAVSLAGVLACTALIAPLRSAASGAAQEELPTGAAARDFTGIWMNDFTLDEVLRRLGKKRADADSDRVEAENAAFMGKVPPDILTPEYVEIRKQRRAAAAKLAEGAAWCRWPGMPGIMTYPYPFEILHTKGRVNFIFEAESQVRRVWLGRKEHLPEDELDPSYNGDSIGRWEGYTLVIDTVGFNTQTTVRGLPHSEELHIVERIHYVRPNVIQVDMTFTDPKAFTRPFTQRVQYSRRPDWRIREYSCQENNRSAPDAEGKRSGAVVN